jgi:hypothetical protein
MWPQGFCPGVTAEIVLCPGSGRSWVWDKGAAVCQRCHEPATWMGLRPPRRKEGAFRTKVPPHVNRMPGIATFSQKAQIEILKAQIEDWQIEDWQQALREIVESKFGRDCDCLTLTGIASAALERYGERVEAENKS